MEYYIIGLFIDQFGADWVAKFLEWRRMMEKKWEPAEFDSAFDQRFQATEGERSAQRQ